MRLEHHLVGGYVRYLIHILLLLLSLLVIIIVILFFFLGEDAHQDPH